MRTTNDADLDRAASDPRTWSADFVASAVRFCETALPVFQSINDTFARLLGYPTSAERAARYRFERLYDRQRMRKQRRVRTGR